MLVKVVDEGVARGPLVWNVRCICRVRAVLVALSLLLILHGTITALGRCLIAYEHSVFFAVLVVHRPVCWLPFRLSHLNVVCWVPILVDR